MFLFVSNSNLNLHFKISKKYLLIFSTRNQYQLVSFLLFISKQPVTSLDLCSTASLIMLSTLLQHQRLDGHKPIVTDH